MGLRNAVRQCMVCLIVAALFSGCATLPRGGADNPCDVKAAAAIGGVIGGLIGGARGDGKGAVLGAAAGAALTALTCVAVNAHSRRTRSAEQVDGDYTRARGRLPPEPVVVSYASTLSSNPVRREQPLTVNSTIELVNGSAQPIKEVREELQIFNPDGTPIKNGIKPITANAGGRYENQFELKLPANAPQGLYAMKTILYVNGAVVASRDLTTQLVWNGRDVLILVRSHLSKMPAIPA